MPRALVEEERAILEFLLAEGFPGRDELRAQLDHLVVTGPACACGCESVALAVERRAPPAAVDERVPTEALGRDAQGTEVGVLLHVIDGYMAELEFFSLADAKGFGRTTLDSLQLAEWSEPGPDGTRTLLNP
jgi:hypothetical protein